MRVLIRADGDPAIGIGHVTRTLALAEAVIGANGSATLASASLTPALAERMWRLGGQVVQCTLEVGGSADLDWLTGLAAERGADWVVVDGYRFSPAYLEGLRRAGPQLLVLDDYAPWDRYPADLVLNQNIYASRELYPAGDGGPRYLLGPRFALLRSEIVKWGDVERTVPERGRRILITLGGADPYNAGRGILEAVSRLADEELEIRLVLGPSNPHRAAYLAAARDPRVTITPAVEEMGVLMAWADLAITGAGSTVYELACTGVPTMVVALAGYQNALAAALARERLVVDLGPPEALAPERLLEEVDALLGNPALRAELSQRGRARVDGKGAVRVLNAMSEV